MKLPTIQVRLKSVTPLSQSRYHNDLKKEGEDDDSYDRRTWRSHLHVHDGEVIIPPMTFKFCFDDAVKSLALKKSGRYLWTNTFKTGVLIADSLRTGKKVEDSWPETILANSNGKRGTGTRVPRTYPMINDWEGKLQIICVNPEIFAAEEKEGLRLVTRIIEFAGQCVGVGRFAPRVGGYLGRFSLEDLKLLSG